MPIPLLAYVAAAGGVAYLILRKKPEAGATPSEGLGHAARNISAADLVVGPGGLTFTKQSPPGFVGTIEDEGFAQIGPGDFLTVDVGAAGIVLAEIPSGNMLFRVVGSPNMTTHMIAASSIDPRLPATKNVVNIPQRAISDAGAKDALLADLHLAQ